MLPDLFFDMTHASQLAIRSLQAIMLKPNDEPQATMPQTHDTNLNKAFEATDYLIHTGDEWQQVNIGMAVPNGLCHWLHGNCDAACAWLITAHNPQAVAQADNDNRQRHAALQTCLVCANHRYVEANSRAHDRAWPDEPGVCIVDMDEGLVRALALRFEQAAVVAVPVGGLPQLVWVDC